eukprot:scaffold421223_cov47-Attheya_sp.AAC.1
MRLFDAHNHVHLGLSAAASGKVPIKLPFVIPDSGATLMGMALQSTHPRDFPVISRLTREYAGMGHIAAVAARNNAADDIFPTQVVPCFGVHPWFLHEVEGNSWLEELEEALVAHPEAAVGEIGLDSVRYPIASMERQVEAMDAQLELAYRYQRPVSIHCVHAYGPLFTSISKNISSLPPRIYLHAFGGHPSVVDQLDGLVKGTKKQPFKIPRSELFFGFAPFCNFRNSKKTRDAMRRVGLDRLVLETDLENYEKGPEDLILGLEFMADALDLSPNVVARITTQNTHRLYNLPFPNNDQFL